MSPLVLLGERRTMKVNLYNTFCTDTLRHRETARKILEKVSKASKTDPIVIDFSKISFASQSFLHELIVCLADRKVVFLNQNEEVEKMISIISKSFESASDGGFGKRFLLASGLS
jgi:hypothetical protein